ncbi:MaoC family dehydratase [Amycolatopsis sp. FDAARGOS 1241]|nr:MaoC family dehydratase [Amycolatopsis sp. FDAARGOS 1241]
MVTPVQKCPSTARNRAESSREVPGVDVDLAKVLHGTQEIELHRPILAHGEALAHTRTTGVFDKGKAAVLVEETTVTYADGNRLWTARSGISARGEGGFGGERVPSQEVVSPDREPDAVLTIPTLPQQALLYRLCGDLNPLNADPAFARVAGFDRPILHGPCTYGVVAKALTDAFLDGDPARIRSFGMKFAGVVFRGERLRTRVWREDNRLLPTTTAADRDDAPVLSDTVLVPR